MDLARALSFSRYAQRALLARPALSDELVATLGAPFDWASAVAEVDAVAAGGDGAASCRVWGTAPPPPRRCVCCAGGCSSIRWRVT